MVKCNSEGLNTDCRELSQVHRVFAKDARINPLVEIDPSLHRHSAALQFRSWHKSQISDFSNDVFESNRCDDIVVHQNEIFLFAIQGINALHNGRYWLN